MTARATPRRAWRREKVTVARTAAGGIELILCTPKGVRATDPTPVLYVNDGPYYSRYAALSTTVAAAIGAGTIPPVRLALLEPGPRFQRYSAAADYSRALVESVMPQLESRHGGADPRLFLGASLGGLAALHLEWTHPGTCAGLFLQSGSFFTRTHERYERAFPHFAQVTRFVGDVHRATRPRGVSHIVMTCGHEQNLRNNEHMAQVLSRLGQDLRFRVIDGGHTWRSWRGGLERYLVPWIETSLARWRQRAPQLQGSPP